jgi:MFS transporter, DHA1 family, multidrug resistance protein
MKNNKLAVGLLMFNMFITMLGIGIIIPVMPAYLHEFGVGGQVLGFLIAGFAFAQFLFSPIAGDLSDRYGRKPFIVAGLIIYAGAQFLFGVADAVWILFLSRFLSGFGAALIAPPIMAYIADITSYEERGKGMGMLGAAMSLGFMVGPGFGGFLAKVNLTFPFFLAAAISLVAAIVTIFLLPSVKPAPVTTKRENIFKQLARSVKVEYFVLLIIIFTFSFGIANFQSTLALLLADKFNYSSVDIAIVLTVGGFVGVLLQMFIVDKLFKRFGEMKVILVNLLLAAGTMLLIVYISGFFVILTVATLFSIGTTFIRPAVNTLVSKFAGREQGFASGMNNAYMSLGNMIGPAIAGSLFEINMNAPYWLGTIILLACFFLAFIWSSRVHPQLLKPSK